MPRKSKKKEQKQVPPQAVALEEDDVASIASDATGSTCQNSDEECGISEIEKYEEKIKDAMNLATEKSVQTRINALIALKTALQKRVLTSFLMDHYQTIGDIIERSLKKGRGLEQVSAAKLASTFIVSLLGTEESEEVYKTLSPPLSTVVQDPTAAPQARKEAGCALALIAFLACPEPSDIPNTLNLLHNIFCNALPKGNGELPNHPPLVVALHASALQGVCLLLTLLSYTTVYTMAQKMLEEFEPVLETTDLDLRISVGEALALVHERARFHDEDFRWKKQAKLLDKLDEFINESHKYKGKKDKKQQRASFREIVQTIKDGDEFSEIVYIGPSHQRQELNLSSWSLRFQYQALCHALEEGSNIHMTYNTAVRDLFDLGPPPITGAEGKLLRGPKRPNRQTPEAKARLMTRSKNRDNRAASLMYED